MNSNELPAADGDWRSQLQNVSRERVVNKIMDTVKLRERRRVLSGQEGDEEYRKMARRLEEKVYHEATSQSDYLKKLALKSLTIESQFIPPGALPFNFAGISGFPQDPASSDSTSQTSISDLQYEVYQKIQAMKDLHSLELHGLHQKLVSKMQQHTASDGDRRLSSSKQMLERILQGLQIPPPLRQGQYSSSYIQFLQSQENGVNSQLHSVHLQCDITSSQPNMMISLQVTNNIGHSQVDLGDNLQFSQNLRTPDVAETSTTKRAKKLYARRSSISQSIKTRLALASALRRSPRKLTKDKASKP